MSTQIPLHHNSLTFNSHLVMTKTTPHHDDNNSEIDSELSVPRVKSKKIEANESVKMARRDETYLVRFVRAFFFSMSGCTACIFFCVALLVAVLVWAATFTSGMISTNSALDGLRQEFKTSALNQLQTLLVTPMTVLSNQKALVEELNVDLTSGSGKYAVARQFARVLENHQDIDFSLFLHLPNGDHVHAQFKDETKEHVMVEYALANTQRIFFFTLRAHDASLVSSTSERNYNDTMTHTDWYQHAIAEDRPLVSVLHSMSKADNTGSILGYTYTLPLFDNGALRCVFGAELGLNNIGGLLQKLRIGKSGTAFMMQRTGMMIATSNKHSVISDGSSRRVHATSATSYPHRTAAQILEDTVTIEKVPDGHSVSFNGYVADVFSFNPILADTGKELLQRSWLLVTVLPLFRDYTNIILWSNLISVACTMVLIVILAAATVLLYIFIFVRPLRRLIKDLHCVQTMQLDNIKERRLSQIFEIRELEKRFRKSVHFLKLFRQFLPQSLLDAQIANYTDRSSDAENTDEDNKVTVVDKHKDGDESDSTTGQSTGKHTRHSSHRSGSNSQKRLRKERATLSTFEIGVRESKMAMLSVNLLGADLVIDMDVDSYTRQHSAMLAGFNSVVRIQKGTVERFDDQFYIASFFSMRQAIAAAVELKKKLTATVKRLQDEERHNISYCIGLSWGLASYGVLGAEQLRVNHIFGKATQMSKMLANVGNEWPSAKILLDKSTINVLDSRNFVTRPVCSVTLSPGQFGATEKSIVQVHEVLGSSQVAANEWLYEHSDVERLNSVEIYRAAYKQIESKKSEEAVRLLREYLSVCGDDEVAKKHLEQQRSRLDE